MKAAHGYVIDGAVFRPGPHGLHQLRRIPALRMPNNQ
jgi:hypothetical protein